MTSDSGTPPQPTSDETQPDVNSAEILGRMEALFPEVIDLELTRVERLLETLGRPQDALPPVAHIAGTNGKGSVIAFLRAILEAAGDRVHTFTSPHLVTFHERISLAAEGGARQISEAALTRLLTRVEAANTDHPITFFEITTAAAFLAYAETPADFVLLETGLGGRLDATNVIAEPAVTIIMPVSYDHAHYLGETLSEIATEKAGILKPGVPCVVARQEEEALAAIEARAEAVGAPLILAGRDWDAFEQHGRLVFQTGETLLDLPLPRLLGRHQIDNAGAAIAAARLLLGERAVDAAIATGLTSASWPARLQRLSGGPLDEWAGEGAEILLDGGHNPAAGEVLAHTMAELEEKLPKPLHLVCGMMETKSAAGFFAPFEGLAELVVTIPVPGRDACHDADSLAHAARAQGLNATAANSLKDALAVSAKSATEPVRILICGSLYLAGDVLRLHRAAAVE
ncbi:MAG: bifunctional folylpolyglutamate synthase/dihydrofolate synthase [Hyphomicrobiales bacterium]|nr:bifunctional folylpolyglutamate synthase/dihydrofolate synthase [Hyphomicrobiales bacterium]